MRIAAYQTPLLAIGSFEALKIVRERVAWCEDEGVAILCCPEAILGGLADYADDPSRFAIDVESGELESVLAPIASESVTTIVGFTELGDRGQLYNTAAVFQRGSVAGVYRKVHPAINRSVYEAGNEAPVFLVAGLTFGIVICNDSNYPELTRRIAAQGAKALFVPTNNALPPTRATPEPVAQARNVDIATAKENRMWVIRADVAGQTDELVSYGSSEIVDEEGRLVRSAQQLREDLLVAEITNR